MNYSVFGHFQWIHVDANIFKAMTRKTEKKEIVFVRVDGALVMVLELCATAGKRVCVCSFSLLPHCLEPEWAWFHGDR